MAIFGTLYLTVYIGIRNYNEWYPGYYSVTRVYKITATGCNTTATPTVTIDGTDYYKQGTAVTVSATVPSSGMKKFTATGVEASLTETLGQYTLTTPANDVTMSLADFTPTITVDEAAYTGEPLTPAITVKDGETPLTADTDYMLSVTFWEEGSVKINSPLSHYLRCCFVDLFTECITGKRGCQG